jgi:serine/threonine-protein kinase
MLVGKPYWARERKASDGLYPYLMKVVRGAKVPARERAAELGVNLPPAFDAWFSSATSTSPDERPPSAVGLVSALAIALDVVPPAAPTPPSAREPLPSIAIESGSDAGLEMPVPSSGLTTRASTAPTMTAPDAKEQPAKEPSTDTAPSLVAPSLAMTRSDAPPPEDGNGAQGQKKPRRGRALAVTLLAAGLTTVIGAIVMILPMRNPRSSEREAMPVSAAAPGPVLTEVPRPAPTEAQPAPSAPATAAAAPEGSATPVTTANAQPAPTSAPTVVSAVSPPPVSGKGPASGVSARKPPRVGKDPLNEY